MKWLATPRDHRNPPTLIGFMGTYGVREYDLAMLMTDPMLLHEVMADVRPWLERISEVKNAVLRNATDPERKDQWTWMKRFEKMVGRTFLPDEDHNEKGEVNGTTARKRARPATRDEGAGEDSGFVSITP